MRIAQLDLKAFGHFTDRRIVFADSPDFHLAYGPNEAGKTTISRALNAALFGIPHLSQDNHLHANADMRVGVVLQSSTGELLAAMRRKARKNSLVAYDPETGEERAELIPEERLGSWMGGLSEGLFGSMFGLDHEGLVAGGRMLAEGKGELGQSLFEASAGLSAIRILRERLTAEADALFRPRASSSAIYKALDQYNEARRQVKEAQTRPADWETLKRAADEAAAAYGAARERQETLQREARRLERLAAVLPDVAARAHLLEQLERMGAVVSLTEDHREKRLDAQSRLRQAKQSRQEADDAITRMREELTSLTIPDRLLAEAGAIEALYHAVESFRNARDALAAAHGRITQAKQRIEGLLVAMADPRRDKLRELIPGATLRARVQHLITQGTRIRTELQGAQRQADTGCREVAELKEELARLGVQPVPPALAGLLDGVETQGDPEALAIDAAREAKILHEALVREAAALSSRPIGELATMAIPLPAELQRFRDERDSLEARRQAIRDRIEGIENDRVMVQGDIDAMSRLGDVPTAEQLATERQWRDSLWQRIRCRVYPEAGRPGDDKPLPAADAYESAIEQADRTADHRFTDVARVAEHDGLRKRAAQMSGALALEAQRRQATEAALAALDQEWATLVVHYQLPTLDVARMTDWLQALDRFRQRHERYADLQSRADLARHQADELRTRLAATLADASLDPMTEGEPLARAVARARVHRREVGEALASQKVLDRKLKTAETRLAEVEVQITGHRNDLDKWRTAWQEAMALIRLDASAEESEATARLQQFDQLEEALRQLEASQTELITHQDVVTRTETEASRLGNAVGLERGQRPADAVAEALYEQLTEGRATAVKVKTLIERMSETEHSRHRANQAVAEAEATLAALIAAARCGTEAELVDVEVRSAEHRRLTESLADTESRLVTASAMTLPELLVQAAGQDIVQIEAALFRVSEDLDASRTDLETVHTKSIEALASLANVDGSAVSAQGEQQAAEVAARLATQMSDYAAARLASVIIGEVVEAYQQRNQGPLLARASELYAAISGGRFTRVAADFDEDKTVLVAVRPDGRRLTVEKLSSGRRDQLFLALRLAAIESHVTRQEPLPVVIDDILVNFDDEASSATFRVLAELSRKTQVLFFTHHEHLIGRASAAVGIGAFTSQRLLHL